MRDISLLDLPLGFFKLDDGPVKAFHTVNGTQTQTGAIGRLPFSTLLSHRGSYFSSRLVHVLFCQAEVFFVTGLRFRGRLVEAFRAITEPCDPFVIR